ncbi:MAG: hypothetical protein ACNA71_04970 [Kiritimatiellia bacterium]
MADIAYICRQCQITRMISEFADPTKILCGACNCTMVKAGSAQDLDESTPPAVSSPSDASTAAHPPVRPAKENKLKLAREKPVELAPDEKPGEVKTKKILEPETTRAPLDLHPKNKTKKPILSQPVLAFLLFVIVGGASYLTFNGGFFDHALLEPVMQYAWAGVLALHATIVLKAFTEDMMQGILCLFIPGWSFLYLAISDLFYHKAVIFGLLIGFGYAGSFQLWEFAVTGMQAVQQFIDSGGGNVR